MVNNGWRRFNLFLYDFRFIALSKTLFVDDNLFSHFF